LEPADPRRAHVRFALFSPREYVALTLQSLDDERNLHVVTVHVVMRRSKV
jgi:hypothetical protein